MFVEVAELLKPNISEWLDSRTVPSDLWSYIFELSADHHLVVLADDRPGKPKIKPLGCGYFLHPNECLGHNIYIGHVQTIITMVAARSCGQEFVSLSRISRPVSVEQKDSGYCGFKTRVSPIRSFSCPQKGPGKLSDDSEKEGRI